jgi:hypothetical protein
MKHQIALAVTMERIYLAYEQYLFLLLKTWIILQCGQVDGLE